MNPYQILSECKSLAFLLLYYWERMILNSPLLSISIEYDLIEQSN